MEPIGNLEEMVGRCLIACFKGEAVNDDAKRLIFEAKVGGFIYFKHTNGLGDHVKVKKLSADLQALSPRKLWIGVDQEGGRVARIVQTPASANLENPGEARETATKVARQLVELGINLNFAPVADVCSKDTFIGDRSYGDDPNWVARMAREAMAGYREGGVTPCFKHFPGHGDTKADSHRELPVVDKSLEELGERELIPYLDLEDVPMVMTAHVLYPKLDAKNPATLSPTILQDLLRGKLRFKGLIVSDCLTMKGVTSLMKIEEVAIRALQAGCNLLIIGDPDVKQTIRIHKAIVAAVRSGVIPKERFIYANRV